jgi:hypothetical protein
VRKDIEKLPPGRHADKTVPGLILTVRERPGWVVTVRGKEIPSTSQYWSLRYRGDDGKWREVGLGAGHSVSLDQARKRARRVARSADPVAEARSMRAESPPKVDGVTRRIGRDGKTYPV